MNRSRKPLIFAIILAAFMAFSQIGLAQGPVPPPPPPADKGSTTNKGPSDGGGAPIDGGVNIALALVTGFGAWKLFKTGMIKKQFMER